MGLLLAALLGQAHAASADHPAGQLPTHFVIERGADAWSGRLRALQFLPTLGTLDAPTPPDRWEASTQLDAASPDARQLWTFHHDGRRTPVPLRWNALSTVQQSLIDDGDGRGADRVDYLRGSRRHENAATGLRPRHSVLGAMRGARVQLLGPPGFVLDARHGPFRQQQARRPWMVYVGANDGLLHGFDALTGAERFAVMPDAVLPIAARNTSPSQPVASPICRHPFAADAQTGTQWRSMLACANGTMAPGLFLVDVTDPTSTASKALLAYDTSDDPAIGHMEGPIPIVPLADDSDMQSRWFALSGNGMGDARVETRLLLLALDQPPGSAWQPGRTAYTIAVPKAASLGGLGAPVVALGSNGRATFAYAADAVGQIWRFDLRGTAPWPQALGRKADERRRPFFTAQSRSGVRQHIPGPILLAATAGGPLLVFTAVDADGNAMLYGVKDTGNTQRDLLPNQLAQRKATELGDGVTLQPGSNRTPDTGWRIDLPPGQQPDDLIAVGTHGLLLTVHDAQGRQRAYLLDPRTGLPADRDGRTGQILTAAPLITVQSAPAITSADGSLAQTTHTSLWQADGNHLRKIETHAYTRKLGRLSWRELIHEATR